MPDNARNKPPPDGSCRQGAPTPSASDCTAASGVVYGVGFRMRVEKRCFTGLSFRVEALKGLRPQRVLQEFLGGLIKVVRGFCRGLERFWV